ncbi:hypothetical protein QBC32DRAFT_314522 [Pseudoneurospora amorphoporcata]|uniref:Uncharacterized protein n=1 Tax=Pseudoneurospora amorphoporcata TaxID=241081 RepID=A0AAN6NXA2_9PEZI|nr:hypothetical protein QBC32DRAFT_314522 [Pseudoneurospora amorphoporcata]
MNGQDLIVRLRSEDHADLVYLNVWVPYYDPNAPPRYRSAVLPQGVYNNLVAEYEADTAYAPYAHRILRGRFILTPELAILARRVRHALRLGARDLRIALGLEGLTFDVEKVDPLPVYTKLPSAEETTVKISPSTPFAGLPNYLVAAGIDNVVAGKKRKRARWDQGRLIVKRFYVEESEPDEEDGDVDSLTESLKKLSLSCTTCYCTVPRL